MINIETKNNKNDKLLLHQKNNEKKTSKNNINNLVLNLQVIKRNKTKKEEESIYNKKNINRNHVKKKYTAIDLYSNTRRPLNINTNGNRNNQKDLDENNNNKNNFKDLNDQELNNLDYKNAIKYDKRTYFQYYWSLLKKKQLLLFTFFPTNDYNLISLKIALLILSFSLYFTINGFFFTDDTMHKVYKDNGVFDFIYQIPQILYSNLICTIINLIVRFLSLSQKDILSIKAKKVQ